MSLIKSILRKTPFYKSARNLYRILKGDMIHPLQIMPNVGGLNIVHLGSESCGWSFIDDGDLQGCTIISAGLGEDASFDVEFAKKYGAKVIMVDPTPRAIEHFNKILENIGKKRARAYSKSARQPVEAYDLEYIDSTKLILVKKALWIENTRLKFFSPPNPHHVSHSIVNYQQGYSGDTSYIEVETITMPQLLKEFDLNHKDIPLIKLDIEGAEIEVLHHCMSHDIKPRQILVEFDELNAPSVKGFERVDKIHETLCENGYQLVRTDGQADFLYLRRD